MVHTLRNRPISRPSVNRYTKVLIVPSCSSWTPDRLACTSWLLYLPNASSRYAHKLAWTLAMFKAVLMKKPLPVCCVMQWVTAANVSLNVCYDTQIVHFAQAGYGAYMPWLLIANCNTSKR